MIKTLMKTEQIESFLKGLKESKKKEVMEFLYAMFKRWSFNFKIIK